MVKDVLGLLREHSAIQLICKEIAPQANLQLDCTCIKQTKNILLRMYLTFGIPFLFFCFGQKYIFIWHQQKEAGSDAKADEDSWC